MRRTDLISTVSRFWAKVDRSQECWLWTGEVNSQGYGRFDLWVDDTRQRVFAHRLAFTLSTGEDASDQVVRHDCDIPRCCNPAHLRLGTQSDNMRDAVERSRADLSGLTAFRDDRDRKVEQRIAEGRKRCSKCGVTKPFSDFHKARTSVDGRQGWCKPCRTKPSNTSEVT